MTSSATCACEVNILHKLIMISFSYLISTCGIHLIYIQIMYTSF